MIGKKFNRLLVLGNSKTRKGYMLAQCDCGKRKEIRKDRIKSGYTKSCGCLVSESNKRTKTIHGSSRSSEHQTWGAIKDRCYNQKNPSYKNYGGRGIRICFGWDSSFVSFLNDLGHRPQGNFSIDRKDNNGHYSCGQCKECKKNGWPMNCRRATLSEQHRNYRQNRIFNFRGKYRTIPEISEMTGFPWRLLYKRLVDCKWSVERATTAPVYTRFNRKGIGGR